MREEVTRTAGCFKRRVSELAARPSRRFVEGAAACSTPTMFVSSWWSVATFLFQIVGYVGLSTALEFAYYHRRGAPNARAAWKIQPGARVDIDAASPGSSESRYAWGFPAWNLATGRHPRGRHRLHGHFATINLALSALFAGATCEAHLRGWSALNPLVRTPMGVALAAWATAKMIVWQSAIEYAWHRAMHTPALYKRMHKYHHHYKSPRPWDDLFISPAECFGYLCILYSPAYCVGGPTAAFLAYMALMGVTGVLDHSGVNLSTWGYGVRFHDMHHSMTVVNFAFPFPALDILFGTYRES